MGGPTYSVAHLTKYLPKEFEIKLIGGQKDDFEEGSEFILKDLEINYSILPSMKREVNFRQDRQAYKEVKRIIAEFKPDIVHTHAAKAGAIGRLAAHRMGVPIIVHTFHGHVFHSYFGKIKTWIYKSIERYLAKRSSAIVTLSKQQNEEITTIHKICSKSKARIIPLGFHLDRFKENQEEKRKKFRETWCIDEDTVVVGLVGRVVPIKNHGLFLEAFKHALDSTNKQVIALIVGDGDVTQDVFDKAKELGLNPTKPGSTRADANVIFTSWIKEIDQVNAAIDIMALSSLNEGTPVSLIEAQAAAVPVVSTDVGGVSDIVVEGESGFLSPSGNAQALGKNMLRLIEDKDLRKMMGNKGREFAFGKFHYLRFCQDMANLYYELMDDFENKHKKN